MLTFNHKEDAVTCITLTPPLKHCIKNIATVGKLHCYESTKCVKLKLLLKETMMCKVRRKTVNAVLCNESSTEKNFVNWQGQHLLTRNGNTANCKS